MAFTPAGIVGDMDVAAEAPMDGFMAFPAGA